MGVPATAPALPTGVRSGRMRDLRDRLSATAYAHLYDPIVAGFRPYQALLDEIAGVLASLPPTAGRSLRVLDISCGTGTAAARLAASGHTVVGVDPVPRLVDTARRRHGARAGLQFHHADIASHPVPGAGSFDAVLSMHTLYWHHDPPAVLAACRRVLAPHGHGVFLTYGRPASVVPVFRDVVAAAGVREAVHALRWLVPTAVFEAARSAAPRYLTQAEFHQWLVGAGFTVTESRRTFVAGLTWLACARPTAAALSPGAGG